VTLCARALLRVATPRLSLPTPWCAEQMAVARN
jgi:hypothetical protein